MWPGAARGRGAAVEVPVKAPGRGGAGEGRGERWRGRGRPVAGHNRVVSVFWVFVHPVTAGGPVVLCRAGARVGAQEPEVAKGAPGRRAGIAHAEEAAVTLSAEDLEQPPPGRAHAHARPRHLAVSSPLPARCEPAGSRGVSVRDRARSASLPEKKTWSFSAHRFASLRT